MREETENLVTEEDNTEYGSTTETLEKESLELNEIYGKIGRGPAQYLYWILVGLVSYSDYAELTAMSVILPALRCEWGLSSTFEAVITISVFGSYAVCSMIFGRVGDRYGRKRVLQWSMLFLLLAAISGAASPNKWVFLASRLVTGACIGINICCSVCYATEFAESKYRAIGIFIFILTGYVGGLAVNAVAWLVLRSVGWRWYIIIVSLPAIPALVMIFVLPASPRYLCVSGQQDKAMQAVRFMAQLNRVHLPDNIRMVCFENEDLGSYAAILNDVHRRSTGCLSVIYFSNIFIEFGTIIFLPLLFSSNICTGTAQPPEHTCNFLTQEDLWKLTITSIGSIIGIVIGFICVEYIGRLLPTRVASGLLIIPISTLFMCMNVTAIFIAAFVMKLLGAFLNNTIWTMIPESFPTSIRSTATGFINSWGKVGGVLGTGSIYLLFYISPSAVVGLLFGTSIIGFVGILVNNRETKDTVLQET